MTTEERLDRLERLVQQLWKACHDFRIETDNCECGCCPDYTEIDIPDFPGDD